MAVSWWLPKNYSEHGVELDHLFNWIFWITTIVMLGTFAAMIVVSRSSLSGIKPSVSDGA